MIKRNTSLHLGTYIAVPLVFLNQTICLACEQCESPIPLVVVPLGAMLRLPSPITLSAICCCIAELLCAECSSTFVLVNWKVEGCGITGDAEVKEGVPHGLRGEASVSKSLPLAIGQRSYNICLRSSAHPLLVCHARSVGRSGSGRRANG